MIERVTMPRCKYSYYVPCYLATSFIRGEGGTGGAKFSQGGGVASWSPHRTAPVCSVDHINVGDNAQETGTRNVREKFDASSSQFLVPKQLSGQSHCTVRVTCRTVSVLEQSCVLLSARNLYQKNTCTRLTDTSR